MVSLSSNGLRDPRLTLLSQNGTYRAVKEAGQIKMSVGIIAYYQVNEVMQVCQAEYFRQLLKPVT
ncbi:hypothetical protein HS088_TW13G01205 [Tripterygium wilfordii]|uniref:Uncharacterized protein n=1 Tax=Tripterygium wilfordii TaxID=458696 RepID=A0A7J7CWJ1_TRIWF|nr:hypothetical protein HS088_TW13G01205 [Tripterygium wilfordii]